MSKITDFAFEDVMSEAVKLFGHDAAMESCGSINQLKDWIGEDSLDKIAEELDKQ